MKPSFWKREPALVKWGTNGIEELIDYNPPPLGVDDQELQRLFQALPNIPHKESFIASARLYSLALKCLKEDVDSSYQLLVASVESIANEVCKSFKPEESEQVKSKENVVKLAKRYGLSDDQARNLALAACKSDRWIARKFTKFICDFTNDDLWLEDDLFRSSGRHRYLPKKENFKEALSQIYSTRGRVTHAGHSYPTSAQITGGAMVPDRIMLEFGNDPPSLFPPVIWFERVVNQALMGFLRRSVNPS